uniref:Chitin-binding type-2 domain-containing protein n=1 Tax=Anopheles funestus TaxID=62324 RepID=A0A182RF44_ANOFN
MPRRLLAGCCRANCRVVCSSSLPLLLLLLLTGTEVRGHVSEPSSSSSSNSVRTVMDLMEVMLNRNILDMLKNGGFDFREPARIFLPPKFYSIVPLDQGHMSPDQIFTYDQQRIGPTGQSDAFPSSVTFGGKADQQPKPSGVVAGDKPTVRDAVSETGGGSRINLISYSDGKVTTAGGVGNGRQPAVTNKGSETLEKNVATNGPVGGVPTMARMNFQERINGKEMTPANEQQQQRWQPSLTTSITDQTVSQNVGRTLPTSGRFSGGSTTDRLRSALPGEPDVDYPILSSVPTTQFSCDKRHHGYYADVETRCQVFRVCANTDSTGRGFAFLCPNGTLFNQRHLVCDWYMNVRCEESENFYHVNDAIGGAGGGRSMVSDNRQDMMKVVMSMVTYPMRSLMDMMNGVGVIKERTGGGVQKQLVEVKMPPSSRREDYVTPGTGLEPPFNRERTRITGSVNNFSPVMNNFVAGVSSPVAPPADQRLSNVFRPKLDNVYVSSLGTLSTDPDSGFDPVRSTLLSKTDGTVGQMTGVPRTDTYGVVNMYQPAFVRPAVATDIQLVRADLVKSWDDQSEPSPPQQASLKLAPVLRTQPQQTATPLLKFQPQHQTTHSVLKQGTILPPTGVLPPSSFTRTVAIGGSKKYADPSVHRFAPVRTVLPIQQVTVVPENSYQLHSNFHTPLGNLYPANSPTYRTIPMAGSGSLPVQTMYVRSGANYPYTGQPQTYAPVERSPYQYTKTQQAPVGYNRDTSNTPTQLLRRSDVPRATVPATNVSPRRLKTTTVLQVVPSLSFYLNDAQEKRAFDEAVRQGLFDERRRRAYTSYDAPLGSVGRLGSMA